MGAAALWERLPCGSGFSREYLGNNSKKNHFRQAADGTPVNDCFSQDRSLKSLERSIFEGLLDIATLCDFFELRPFTIITLKVEQAILIVNIEPSSVTRAFGLKHYGSGEAKGSN